MVEPQRCPPRRYLALLSAWFVLIVAAASPAWACVPQPRLITVHPRPIGPPGTEVSINALGFDPGRVEIRWNTADGDLLGVSNGPDFSMPVIIPDVADGLYHVIVLARLPSGGIGNTATVAFQVGMSATSASPPPTVHTAEDSDAAVGLSWIGVAMLVAAGVALVALGCLCGLLSPRRRRQPSPGGIEPDMVRDDDVQR